MIERALLLVIAGPSLVGQLHATTSAPVPHWVVLLVAVPTLWFVIGGAVLVVDRLLQRHGM